MLMLLILAFHQFCFLTQLITNCLKYSNTFFSQGQRLRYDIAESSIYCCHVNYRLVMFVVFPEDFCDLAPPRKKSLLWATISIVCWLHPRGVLSSDWWGKYPWLSLPCLCFLVLFFGQNTSSYHLIYFWHMIPGIILQVWQSLNKNLQQNYSQGCLSLNGPLNVNKKQIDFRFLVPFNIKT